MYRTPDKDAEGDRDMSEKDLQSQLKAAMSRAEKAEKQLAIDESWRVEPLKFALTIGGLMFFIPLLTWICYGIYMLAEHYHLSPEVAPIGIVPVAAVGVVCWIIYMFKRFS